MATSREEERKPTASPSGIDAICDAFEADWFAARQPRIEDFLLRGKSLDVDELLRELLLSEWDLRRRRGEQLELDAYHERFPQYRPAITDLWDSWTAREFQSVSRAASMENSGTNDGPILEALGTVIDRYKLREQIGEGGFGIVFVAEQEKPVRRKVALKIIKPGMDTKEVIARFEAERQALALMDHPNVAKVLDAGATESGQPYFVMELVNGVKITEFCDKNRLSTRQRLELFLDVCRAVQHAHQKGIIHRDLKPSNILVTLHDGKPVPKVIDFGVSKALSQQLTEKSIYTAFGHMIGTPEYMSPEQAEISGLGIDTRSDIYSLGVLLYELLTGSPPFDARRLRASTYEGMVRIIREEEPQRPSTKISTLGAAATVVAEHRRTDVAKLRQSVRGDLDWIVMKALEKDRNRRYDTANSLGLDVQLFLNDEPITARPPSVGYRLQKAWRRNTVVYTAGAAIAIALIGGIAASSWLALQARLARDDALAARMAESEEATNARAAQLRADDQRRLAEANAEELIRHLYVADVKVAFQALQEDNLALARQLVYKYLPALGTATSAAVAHPSSSQPARREKSFGPTRDLLGWEWRHLWQLCQGDASFSLGRGRHVRCVAFSPDGGLLAIGKDDSVEVIDPRTRSVIARLEGFDDHLNHNGLAFSHQGRYLAAKGGTVARIWEVGKWDAPIRQFESTAHVFNNAVEFSADDATFATRVPGGVRFWDTSTWQESHFEKNGATFGTVLHYSHDGEWLAISDWHKIEIHSAKYERLASFERQFGIREWVELWVTAIDSTAQLMAAGYRDGEVIVWETKTWREVGRFRAHPSYVLGLVFAPDGQTLVTGGSDQLIKIWDVTQLTADLARNEPPTPVRMLRGHETAIFGLAYSPVEEALASTSKDGTARFWSDVGAREPSELPDCKEPLWFAPDGTRLITLDRAGRLHHWDTRARRDLGSIGPPLDGALDGANGQAISSDGKWLALGTTDGVIELWNLETNEREKVWKDDDHHAIGQVAFSRGGALLAAANQRSPNNEQGTVRIWDRVSGRRVLELKNAYGPLAFSVNDRLLASTRLDGSAVIWDLATGLAMAEVPEDIIMSGGLAFSPVDDGLASGSEVPIVHIWDVASGQEVDSLMGSRMCIADVAFAPDGRTLLARTVDNAIKLWNVPTGAELLDIGHIKEATSFLFSPNGEYLALSTISGSGEPRLELWRAPSLDEIATEEARRADEVEAQ